MAKTKNVYTVPIRKKDRRRIVSDVRAHSGILKHAIDFPLPEGTPILAALDGYVIHAVDKFNKGGDAKKFFKHMNFIILKHANGEYSEYSHLRNKGSLVKKGQKVTAGETIGYSGNTGWTTDPHLHFHVCTKGYLSNLGTTLEVVFNEKLKYKVNSKSNIRKWKMKYAPTERETICPIL